jgi:hypothetical protein
MEELDLHLMALPDDWEERERTASYMLKQWGLPAVDYLLEKGLSANHLLCLAAPDNSVSLCKVLVEKYGATVNAPLLSPDGGSDLPLVQAAKEGAASAVLWLLQNGASIEARCMGPNRSEYTALWGASQNGYLRVARILLEQGGADGNTCKFDSGITALYIAVQNKRQELCSLLLRHGANVDLVGGDGLSPLAVAVRSAKFPLVALLRNAGAKPCDRSLRDTLAGSRSLEQVSERQVQAVTELLGGMDTILRYVPTHYKAAQALERQGEYRKALQQIALAETVLHQANRKDRDMWAQLVLDEQRLSAAVYGVPGSDGRVSVWHKQYYGDNKQQQHPPPLQFYAWASYKNTIYRHGGLEFMKHEQVPSQEALWAFQDNQWKPVSTTGTSPGPRSGHVACTFKHGLYIFGGKNEHDILDSKLYRLDLQTFK